MGSFKRPVVDSKFTDASGLPLQSKVKTDLIYEDNLKSKNNFKQESWFQKSRLHQNLKGPLKGEQP